MLSGERLSDDQLQPLFTALGHPIRRDMVRLLAEKGPLTYSLILNELELETGTFNYHLERLKDLLDQLDDDRYRLNDRGLAAYELITQAKAGAHGSARAVSKPSPGWVSDEARTWIDRIEDRLTLKSLPVDGSRM